MRLLSTHSCSDPFKLFSEIVVIKKPEDVTNGVLILWGGEDIGTSLYKEKPNSYCHGWNPSQRDVFELACISHAVKNNVPIIGICRGAQLLCVVSGGKLMQHINDHHRDHGVVLHDEFDAVIKCNSSHHQMMLPDTQAKVLATSSSTIGVGENNKYVQIPRVNEVVYFPITNGLGIQPHPEWKDCPKDFLDYCVRKIKEYLL